MPLDHRLECGPLSRKYSFSIPPSADAEVTAVTAAENAAPRRRESDQAARDGKMASTRRPRSHSHSVSVGVQQVQAE